MGNTTIKEDVSDIYVTVDDVDKHLTNTTEISTVTSDLLNKLTIMNSQQYNCVVDIIDDGFLVMGFPKNEPVLYPRLLHTVRII